MAAKKKKPRHRTKAATLAGTRPIAFRLPPDVVRMADAAAQKRCLSRNKLVELILRASLSDFQNTGVPDARQIDLFD